MKRIFLRYLCFVAVLLTLSVCLTKVNAATYQDFQYKILSDQTVEIIKYNGYSADVNIPQTINNYTVTSIGDAVFANSTNLKTVELPETIKSIGKQSFANCSKLVTIELPSSLVQIGEGAFQNCKMLSYVYIPESTISIGDYAFDSCRNLASIDIPQSVVSIGEGAFYYCTGLTNVKVNANTIGKNAYAMCLNLTDVSFTGKITTIQEGTFSFCSQLKTINLPKTITKIDADAFAHCTSLASIDLPENVKSIGNRSFSNCNSLSSIYITKNITSIDKDAFDYCQSLKQITVDSANKKYSSVDNIALYSIDGKKLIKVPNALVNYQIASNVTEIGESSFSTCTKIKSVSIPSTVKIIHNHAFSNCTNLTTVSMSANLTQIGINAFYGCKNLISLNVPTTVTKIGSNAFDNCENIKLNVYNGSYAYKYAKSYNVAYNVIVEKIQLNKSTATIALNSKLKLTATFSPTNASNKTLKWSTSNSKIATVDQNGNVTGKGYGTATITAKTNNGKTATCKITVGYKVTYKLNGGTNNTSNPSAYYKTTSTITLKNPTKKGYTFGGWYSDSKYKTKVTKIAKGSTGNKTLYAKWTATKYTIKYNLNGGTNNKSNPTSYNIATATVTLKNPTRKGYTFSGWYSDSKYKTKVTKIAKGSTGNKTLYAKWTKVSVAKAKTPTLTNVSGRKLKISYSATSGAKGYQIQYSTSSKFTSVKSITTTAKSYTTGALTKNKTYYVRVRAYKLDSKGNKVYGSWSAVRSKKITK